MTKPKLEPTVSVPKAMQDRYDAITRITDAVCDRHLNTEYRDMARRMTAALCRKRPSPLAKGQPRTWACGIVWALGKVNFLSDPSTRPSMTLAELSAAFGVGESTASAKARIIDDLLELHRLTPEWTLPGMLERNPLVWIATVDALPVDLRNMPREVQQIAYEKGLIPYVPADRPEDGGQGG
ncbi:DUF6398 domain-containing protein [Azospirillum sp.]|uniref:DUF6398 domain-containing protein n=1 Tax=Azospirillum sp. TaxID=34012 RepID=UPI003D738764